MHYLLVLGALVVAALTPFITAPSSSDIARMEQIDEENADDGAPSDQA